MNAQNPLASFSFPFDRWRKQIQVYVFASFLGKRKKSDIDLHLGILQQVEIDTALWKWQIFHGENCHRSEQHDLKENSIVTCHRSPPPPLPVLNICCPQKWKHICEGILIFLFILQAMDLWEETGWKSVKEKLHLSSSKTWPRVQGSVGPFASVISSAPHSDTGHQMFTD